MKSIRNNGVTIVCATLFIILLVSTASARDLTKIRLGYQTMYSPIAEVYTTLRHSGILEANGLKGEFTGFSYGAPMAEAIAAGELDAAYGGWMPVLSFFKAGSDWVLVSNIHDFDWYILVRDPKIKDIPDLKGKTLGVPFGAWVQFMAIRLLRSYGMEKDVKFINIDGGSLVNTMQIEAIDGIVVWQGAVSATVLHKKLGHSLPIGRVERRLTGVQALSGKFIKKHPNAAVAFLKAFTMAFSYASKHPDEIMDLYLKDHPQVRFPKAYLETFWGTDRHLRKPTDVKDVDLRITEYDFRMGQMTADVAHELKFLPKYNVKDLANTTLMEKAYREIQAEKQN